MTRVLIVTMEPLTDRLTGQGVRAVALAQTLRADLQVTLAAPAVDSEVDFGTPVVTFSPDVPNTLAHWVAQADVVLVSGFVAQRYRFLGQVSARVVVDLIAPFMIETAFVTPNAPLAERRAYVQQAVAATNALARIGDFFICGSERQRDFWLGLLGANGRLGPDVLGADPDARRLIDVVSFGLPELPNEPLGFEMGDLHPALAGDVQIVWWGGGIWDWLDPLTLLQAWPHVLAAYPQARLVWVKPGSSPNTSVGRGRMAEAAVALADQMGLLDESVVFLDWLTVEARAGLLKSAAVGVVLHPAHLETHFSVRTRVLDFIAAGLPMVITEGDVMSDRVQAFALGEVVSPGDVAEVAGALKAVLAQGRGYYTDRFAQARVGLTWPEVVAPLRHYCLHGAYAVDRVQRQPVDARAARGLMLYRARQVWRAGGIAALVRRVVGYVRRRLS